MGQKKKSEGVISRKKAFGELDEKVVEGFGETEAEKVEESVVTENNEEAAPVKAVEATIEVGSIVFNEAYGEGKVLIVKQNGYIVGDFGGSQRTLPADAVEVR